jgi:hypothetical protein
MKPDIINVTVTSDASNNNEPVLRGMINVINLVAQILFYSRASGIVPRQFLSRISTQQLYSELIPYIYYTRSILNVGTTVAATRGAVLTRTMIDALQFPKDPSNHTALKADTVDEEEETVTILVGHDTDLDAVATAMNVAWQVDDPYSSGTTKNLSLLWYMTPPGSAIYLRHDDDKVVRSGGVDNGNSHYNDTVVTMSYLYPIYNVDTNDGSIQSWDVVPLQLLNTSLSFTTNDNSTLLRWTDLQTHINVTLQQYSGATDCYNSRPISGMKRAVDGGYGTDIGSGGTTYTTDVNASLYLSTPAGPPITTPTHDLGNSDVSSSNSNIQGKNTPFSASWGSGFGSGIAVSIFAVVLVWLFQCLQRRRLKAQFSQPSLQLNE